LFVKPYLLKNAGFLMLKPPKNDAKFRILAQIGAGAIFHKNPAKPTRDKPCKGYQRVGEGRR